jgi:hypothetical protein
MTPATRIIAPLVLLLSAASCSSESKGRPHEELGSLIIAPKSEIPEVNLDKTTSDGEALLETIGLPHSWVSQVLGAHVVRATSELVVREGDKVLEELSDTLVINIDADGRYQMTFDNSKEYGRHATFDGKELFLRPRYGKYHGRPPQNENEAADIRDEVFAAAGDYLELFATRLQASKVADSTIGGRSAQNAELKLSADARSIAASTLTQHAWRKTIEIDNLTGKIGFDAATGVPLAVNFAGTIHYEREGRRFSMSIKFSREISEIGSARSIAAPAEELVLRIPARRRELNERNELLKNIARPARGAPTPQ